MINQWLEVPIPLSEITRLEKGGSHKPRAWKVASGITMLHVLCTTDCHEDIRLFHCSVKRADGKRPVGLDMEKVIQFLRDMHVTGLEEDNNNTTVPTIRHLWGTPPQ